MKDGLVELMLRLPCNRNENRHSSFLVLAHDEDVGG
jgi:hypothetical protein